MTFSDEIIGWYEEYGRCLPWRGIRDAYYIWLSEIILQQTRIEQGRVYYERFVSTYPTIQDLAAADEEQVLKLWQGLGYYSRARNLHTAARYVVNELGGVFPNSYEGILALKGVGRYTAAAIASFAFKLPYPVIDGNVYRLVSRCFGITTPIATPTAYREFESLLLQLMDRHRPDVFNQAMMDFGSLYCRPLPASVQNLQLAEHGLLNACRDCVLAHRCVAYQEGKVDLFPVRKTAVPIKERYFYYLDIRWQQERDECLLVHRRSANDIWRGLYEVPLLEVEHPIPANQIKDVLYDYVNVLCGVPVYSMHVFPPIIHKLTHRSIVATYVDLVLALPPKNGMPDLRIVSPNELSHLPVSRLMERLLALR